IRRPEGFRGKGPLASLLLSHRPLTGMLLRRASPLGLFHENRTPPSFQTGSAEPANVMWVEHGSGRSARATCLSRHPLLSPLAPYTPLSCHQDLTHGMARVR